jgi:GntR family transcriptional regulator
MTPRPAVRGGSCGANVAKQRGPGVPVSSQSSAGGRRERCRPEGGSVTVSADVRCAIADGEITPGERLPPAKDLAAVIGVNTNTVLRALRTLRDEGLLEFRRGRGIIVAGTPDRSMLTARARELVELARQHGYERDELIRIIDSVTSPA